MVLSQRIRQTTETRGKRIELDLFYRKFHVAVQQVVRSEQTKADTLQQLGE